METKIIDRLLANGFQVSEDNTKAWWEGESSRASSISIAPTTTWADDSPLRSHNEARPLFTIRIKNSVEFNQRFKAESDWIAHSVNSTSTYYDFFESQLFDAVTDLINIGNRI